MPDGDTKLERVKKLVKRRAAALLTGSPIVIPSYLVLVLSLRRWRADYGWDSDDVLGFQTYLRGWVPFRDSFRASFLMLYRVPFNWLISGLGGELFTPTRRLFLTSAIYLVIVLWCLNRATGLVTGLTASDAQKRGARLTTIPLLALFSSAGIMLSVVGGTTNHGIAWFTRVSLFGIAIRFCVTRRRVEYMRFALASLVATSLTCGAFGPPELRYFCPTIMVTLVALPGALEQLGTEYLLKLRQRQIARWFVIVLSLALMFAWTEPYYTKHPKSPQFNNQLNLAKKLNERHVDILFAGYWDAGILSYLTGRDVVGLAVQCDGLGFGTRDLNLRSDWKLPPKASYAVYFDATMSKECRSRLPVGAAYDDPFAGSLFFFDENPWPKLTGSLPG